ncbi:MAG TPA: heme exporter protein CcmB [Terriglobales bacterium]|nr:heme exporter protein CcmB [Terriglobales bacterium]
MNEAASPQSVPVITVNNVVKQFGRFAALRGVSAEFPAGRLYAVVGDNGAGKTTLLRTLAGLSKPSRGSVSVLGSSDLSEVCHEVGYMAHPSLLYDEMSGMENLRYVARLYGIDDDARCVEVITAVGLDPALTRPVGQYSQGMRQRMSLARALLNRPQVLLLDEPFSNVDVRSAQEMVTLLARLRDEGRTIFVVTHQASLLDGVANAFVCIEDGKIRSLDFHPTGNATLERTENKLAPGGSLPHPTFPVRQANEVSLFKTTLIALRKDLRLEWRSKDAINSMLFFSLLVVVIFSFAFNPTAEESRLIAGGLIWVSFLFAAVVALNQTWARELRNQVLDAYRVSPAPFNALFLSKAIGNFIFVSVLELLMTPLFVIFYNLRSIGPLYQLLIVALLGTWAIVVNGTFFAAVSLRTRAREIMLPLLLFPIAIPALLAVVEATTEILAGEYSRFWFTLLAAYDVVFTIACLFSFEKVLQAE